MSSLPSLLPLLAATLLGASTRAREPHVPVNATPWSYVAPPLDGHCLQTYRLFLPRTPAPAEGYPVVVYTDLASFQSVSDVTSISSTSHPWLLPLLESGIAVVAARMTVSIPFTTAEQRAEWIRLCGRVPPAIPGHGLFHPPGVTPPDLAGALLPPYEDPAYAMPEKDAVLVIQHVRHLARGHGTGEQGSALGRLDHRRIAVWGTSAGSIAFSWAALGPDRRTSALAALGGQYTEATRVDAAILGMNQVWLPMSRPGASIPFMHWGLDGHSEIAAPTMGAADPRELIEDSPLFYESCELNDELPLYTFAWDTSVSSDYDKSYSGCPGTPFCFEGQGRELALHPTWNQIVLAKLYPGTRVAALGPGTADELAAAGIAHVVAADLPEVGADVASWLAGVFARPSDPWTIIDVAERADDQPCRRVSVAGSRGEPRIRASGSLVAGERFALELTNAAPNAAGWAILGVDDLVVPAFGGLVVPDAASGIRLPIRLDANGQFTLRRAWPRVPSGCTLYAQFFVLDSSAPAGVSATCAALGVSP